MSEPMGTGVFRGWLAYGETGVSSRTMVWAVTEDDRVLGRAGSLSEPFDADDLRRCLLVVDQHPGMRDRFDRVAALSTEWAAIIEHWDELVAIADRDYPKWRTGERWPFGWWSAPLNQRLRELIGRPI